MLLFKGVLFPEFSLEMLAMCISHMEDLRVPGNV